MLAFWLAKCLFRPLTGLFYTLSQLFYLWGRATFSL